MTPAEREMILPGRDLARSILTPPGEHGCRRRRPRGGDARLSLRPPRSLQLPAGFKPHTAAAAIERNRHHIDLHPGEMKLCIFNRHCTGEGEIPAEK